MFLGVTDKRHRPKVSYQRGKMLRGSCNTCALSRSVLGKFLPFRDSRYALSTTVPDFAVKYRKQLKALGLPSAPYLHRRLPVIFQETSNSHAQRGILHDTPITVLSANAPTMQSKDDFVRQLTSLGANVSDTDQVENSQVMTGS